MGEYKHYVRVDANNIVVHGFSDAFENPITGDLLLSGDNGRHFRIQLTTDRGQFLFKLVNGAMTQRNQTELDAEWNARPPAPPSLEQQISEIQDVINVLLMGGM